MTLNSELKTHITADTSSFTKGIAKAKQEAASFSSQMKNSFGGVAKSFAGIFAVTAVASGLKNATEQIDTLVTSARKLNIGVENFQALQYAAKRTDVEMGTLEGGLGKLRLALTDVNKENAFKKLGLDANALRTISLDEAFISVADAIAKIKDPAEQARSAVELLGKSGQSALGLIRGDAKGLVAEFKTLYKGLSEDDVKVFDGLDEQLDKLGTSFKTFAQQAVIALAPFGGVVIENLERLLGVLGKVAEGYKLIATLGPQTNDVNGKPLLNLEAAQAIVDKKTRQTALQSELHNTNSFTKDTVSYFKRNMSAQSESVKSSSASDAGAQAGTAALQAGSSIAKLGSAAASASASLSVLSNMNLKELLGITPADGKEYLSSILTEKTQFKDDTFNQLANELRDNISSGTKGFGTSNESKLAELNSIARNSGQSLGAGETNSGMVAAVQQLQQAMKSQDSSQQVRVVVSVRDSELVAAVVDDTKLLRKVREIAGGIVSREAQSTSL